MRLKALLGIFVSTAVVVSGLTLAPIASAAEIDTPPEASTSTELATPDVVPEAPITLTELSLAAGEATAEGLVPVALTGNLDSATNMQPAAIYDSESKQTLKICVLLTDCNINIDPALHPVVHAQSGAIQSEELAIGERPNSPPILNRDPIPNTVWNVALTPTTLTFEADSEAILTSTVTGGSIGLTSGYSLYVFDETNDELVGYELNASVRNSNVSWEKGDKSRSYRAYVAQFSGYTSTVHHVADLVDIQAISADVEVTRKDWTISIAECLTCGNTLTAKQINVTTNQSGGGYSQILHNVTTDEWTYDGQFMWPVVEIPANQTSVIVAYIGVPTLADPSDPNGPINGATDIQAVSNYLTLNIPKEYESPTSFSRASNGGSNPSQPCYQTCEADPVNTLTGEYWDTVEDLPTITGTTPPLNFVRNYGVSRKTQDVGLGLGWDFNYNMYIAEGNPTGSKATGVLETTPQLDIYQENGSVVSFYQIPSTGDYVTDQDTKASFKNFGIGTASEFILQRNSGEVFIFNNTTGKLKEMHDANNNRLTLTYNSAGKLATVSNINAGKTITFTWTGSHITSVANTAGQTVTYGYTGNKLTSVVDRGAKTWGYAYDTSNRLTVKTDPNLKTVVNTYNTANRITKQVDERAKETTFTYSSTIYPSAWTRVKTPDNVTTEYKYTDGKVVQETQNYGATPTRVTKYQYNGVAGSLSRRTNPDNTFTVFTYDASGNLVSQKNELNKTSSTTYNSMNLPVTKTDAAGNIITLEYDAAGNLTKTIDAEGDATTFIHNPDGGLSKTISPSGAETINFHNYVGMLIGTQNNLNQSINYTRDGKGLITSTQDALGHIVQSTYDSYGNILTSKDQLNNETKYTYDALGRLVTTTDSNNKSSTVTYNELGYPTINTDTFNKTVVAEYDSMNRITKLTDKLGKISEFTYTPFGELKTSKDPLGNITEYEYNWRGQITKTKLPSGKQLTKTYDAAGNNLTEVDAEGNTTTYTYDVLSQIVTTKDAANRIYSYTYDGNGKLLVTTRPDSKTEENTYDIDGRLATYKNAAGNITTYSYNSLGQLLSSSELGTTYHYTYDANGNILTKQNDADGSVLTYTYDSRNLLTFLDYSSSITLDISYTYDSLGRRLTMTDSTGTTSYTYDDLSRIVKVQASNGAVEYEYNSNNAVTAISYPGGMKADYNYDDAGKMTSVSTTDIGSIHYAYNNDSLPTTTTFPNGITTTRSYNANNELEAITSKKGTNELLKYTYEYDPTKLVTKQTTTSSLPAITRNYSYDSLSRMSSLTEGTASTSFGFSDVNSLTVNARGVSLTYDSITHQVTDLDKGTNKHIDYNYDVRGNRTQAAEIIGTITTNSTYSYNQADKLVQANRASNPPPAAPNWTINYTYDGNGLLNSRTKIAGSATTSTKYIWNTNTKVATLLQDDQYRYIYGSGSTPVAQINKTTSTVEYLHSDSLGSIRAVTGSTGIVTAEYLYDEYGNTVAGNLSHTISRFGFAGEYLDTDTGFYYLRARWHDPQSGQFITVDPILSTTHSPYNYVAGNPLQSMDPLGLDFWFDTLQNSADFAAGFGDNVTAVTGILPWIADGMSRDLTYYSVTAVVRRAIGVDDVVNKCSSFYEWGGYAGTAAELVIPGLGVGGKIAKAVSGSLTKGTKAASATTKIANSQLPVLRLDSQKMPEIAKGIKEAWQKGHSDVLTFAGSKSALRDANRTAALKHMPKKRPTGMSYDEYPFASTFEGGLGSNVRVVPARENNIQGGIMRAFYEKYNLQIGDQFRVELI